MPSDPTTNDTLSQLIESIRQTTPPSSGDDLLGFKIDGEACFEEDDGIDDVRVLATNEPAELIRIRVTLGASVESLQVVSQTLSSAWQSLAYAFFQASAVDWFSDAMRLRFVTVISGQRFFVSGCVLATGATYPELVARYERDFARRRDPLEPFPGGIPLWAK